MKKRLHKIGMGRFHKLVKLLFRCPWCNQWYTTTDFCEDCNEE